ncbi:hypothetical protein [Actinomadura rubrisoli]|uniref:Lipoprotein n=1 Tax=Actinomadura rubrisoli TaxID=2530368 RepID=A0A4R5C907_9ACTN|nr:hypothetical protein [Actinomadura rubrisoli]TDD95126.1 hypothetical protein E1298_05640 [Actinomadura rubrisoli]
MQRSVPVLAVLALGGALLLGGCRYHSHSCHYRGCHVTVSGAGQTVEVSGVHLTVSRISSQGMTVATDGSGPTVIGVGQSTRVGRFKIKVASADNDKVKFDIEGEWIWVRPFL